jgi:hypothetical protein
LQRIARSLFVSGKQAAFVGATARIRAPLHSANATRLPLMLYHLPTIRGVPAGIVTERPKQALHFPCAKPAGPPGRRTGCETCARQGLDTTYFYSAEVHWF